MITRLPRRHDFVETSEGLIFAVVDNGVEAGRAICFLRYVRTPTALEKLDTQRANQLLRERFSEYLFHSALRDASLHGVPVDQIDQWHLPQERASELLAGGGSSIVAERCRRLVQTLVDQRVERSQIGVTGSLLLGAETDESDIDLVIYGAESFQAARNAIASSETDQPFTPLSMNEWRDAYQRRGCDLTLEEYVWHERRKHNKAMFEGTKFDIALGTGSNNTSTVNEHPVKFGVTKISAVVTDASRAFEFPARWRIDHDEIDEVLACTPTYTGQALEGEWIEVAGIVEQLSTGACRIVVGNSREATGQWMKVIRSKGCVE